MSGTLFVITVPKAEHEKKFTNSNTNRIYVQNKRNDDSDNFLDIFTDDQDGYHVTFNDESKRNNNSNINHEILIDEVFSEKIVSEVLRALNIHDSAWSQSKDNTYWQISFSIQDQAQSERTLRILRGAELGTRADTSLCVLPCSLFYKSTNTRNHSEENVSGKDGYDNASPSKWSSFVQSVGARQTVAQVVEQIKSDAALTFDYCFLIIVAALLAAIGLVENSTVFIVSSMLISPLMAPIVAGSFGTAIRDRNLLKMGVVHELFGLFICLIIGFIFGLVVCSLDEVYGVKELPTSEILSRSNIRSLWVGVLVALPSGAAVSIAILANNVSSLVGVAISASLLPPAVNAGLLWAMALIQWVCVHKHKKSRFIRTNVFSDNPAIELGIDGFISLCLTLVNIGCIYLAGILVYKIKEVAPATSNDSDFWRSAIRTVRDYNKSNMEDSKITHKNLTSSRLRDLTVSCSGIRRGRFDTSHKELFKKIRRIGNSNMTWSPCSGIGQRISAQDFHEHHRRYSETLTGNHAQLYSKLDANDIAISVSSGDFEFKINDFAPRSKCIDLNARSKFTVVPVDEKILRHSIEQV